MNISRQTKPEEKISVLLKAISAEGRIQILFILAENEGCVCHFEAASGMRQATISQHLMALRKAGLVSSRRDGRHIYYRLVQPDILEVFRGLAGNLDVDIAGLEELTRVPVDGCVCPLCNPGLDSNLVCK